MEPARQNTQIIDEKQKTTTKDMTSGNIALLLIQFALPLLVGNLFQMMYNTVDSLVVGNFVGKEALAAVTSTTMITNIIVFFFNGLSTGATVVISRFFGARDRKNLHLAIETTMFVTLVGGAVATFIGIALIHPMLLMQSTPEDVFGPATTYLRIYFAGILGLIIYNMGSGILRAVGDTKRPLYFLIFTSVVNIILDLAFVVLLKMGVEGVAYATILSQFLSAILVLLLLSKTKDIYRFEWKEICCDRKIIFEIFRIGLPAGIQSILTAFSNVVVQGYVNYFGSACMAGWGCFFKLENFIFLPMNSMAAASTTFVGQNVGAGKKDRVNKGTIQAIIMVCALTLVIAVGLFIFAEDAIGLFSKDTDIIGFGAYFIKLNIFFVMFNCINHTLAGGLRGRGDSTGPMIIMICTFVGLRQLYLYLGTHLIGNTVTVVGMSYPVGWVACAIIETIYFYVRWVRRERE